MKVACSIVYCPLGLALITVQEPAFDWGEALGYFWELVEQARSIASALSEPPRKSEVWRQEVARVETGGCTPWDFMLWRVRKAPIFAI